MRELPEALLPLGAYRQFVAFVLVPSRTRPGKTDKFPINCSTMLIDDAHNPAAWGTFEQALAVADVLGPNHGVGFVLTEGDPFWFLDLDSCSSAGAWTPLALACCSALAGCAIEISSSRHGLHIIGSSPAPVTGYKCKNVALGLEFYTSGRFIALTGIGATGSAASVPANLESVVAAYFEARGFEQDVEWGAGPVPEWSGPTDDAELIERALRSSSASGTFSQRATFSDLWVGNVDALAATWPDPTNAARPYDASSADAALAQHLAFWTGNDCERIERLMRQSALVRDKWTREDYVQRTILGACSRQTVWCGSNAPAADPQIVDPVQPVAPSVQRDGPEQRVGMQFLGIDQQREYFAGCVYVRRPHVIRTGSGALMKPEQFKAYFGGYSFAMDARNVRTVRNAWEAFVDNQGLRWPRADDLTFRPDRAPGELLEHEGQLLVNTWIPVEVPRAAGDPSKFLGHVAKLLPDPRDQAIILAYMAACIQHKGVKFQWTPLVQGIEGNGKTLLSRCVAAAVGDRYVEWPPARDIADKFNDWMFGKIFIGVEDIYVPETGQEVIEALKPMITGDRQQIQGKGEKKETMTICCNFMLNSNHKTGIRKTRNDRRFAPFYTAQQVDGDLARDGMAGDYFPDIYDWLRGSGPYAGQPSGYAVVTDFLMSYAIPDELNPATHCQRAPITSSTEDAIAAGLGSIEQEILEAIATGAQGFAGGWVSSMALDRLLDRLRSARIMPPNKRRELMVSLGYEPHPGLPDGRVTTIIQPDNGKPRLYIRTGHIHANLSSAAAICSAYTEAQRPTTGGAAAAAFAS